MTSQQLYSVESIREIERLAIQHERITEWTLMQRAAQAAFTIIQNHYPELSSIAVFCGSGNNAGDGFLLAALAQSSGIATQVYIAKDISKMGETASRAAQTAIDAGIIFAPLAAFPQAQADLFVDALLGIGIQGNVHGQIAEVIGWLNSQKTEILAMDIPSGLNADTGQVMGMAVKARQTITFIGAKFGLYTADGPDCAGTVIVDSLGLESDIQSIQPGAKFISTSTIRTELPPRPKNCHKGHFGHVLLIGGGKGMTGAIMLAAKATLRVGAGLASIATLPEHLGSVNAFIPEAMCHGVKRGRDLDTLLNKATVLVLGPGLGSNYWARSLYKRAIRWKGPKVVDASALAMLAADPFKDEQRVLTPHPGEAGDLLGCTNAEVQQDRLKALHSLHEKYGGTIVLKGCGSLVAADNRLPYLCDVGNPGMATGGTGDVLSGVIAGLMAQHLTPFNAAALGVYIHAQAADYAALKQGVRGLLASDLITHLPGAVNSL